MTEPTREDILKLTNEQLADMAATEVMGWEKRHITSPVGWFDEDFWVNPNKLELQIAVKDWKPYEDYNQAFMLVEKVRGTFYWDIQTVSTWWSILVAQLDSETHKVIVRDPNLPRAITIACILALHSDSEGKGL